MLTNEQGKKVFREMKHVLDYQDKESSFFNLLLSAMRCEGIVFPKSVSLDEEEYNRRETVIRMLGLSTLYRTSDGKTRNSHEIEGIVSKFGRLLDIYNENEELIEDIYCRTTR